MYMKNVFAYLRIMIMHNTLTEDMSTVIQKNQCIYIYTLIKPCLKYKFMDIATVVARR